MRRKRRGSKRWIQHALRHHKKGALHRMMRIPTSEKIGRARLRRAISYANRHLASPRSLRPRQVAWLRLLRQRAQLALNMRPNRRRR